MILNKEPPAWKQSELATLERNNDEGVLVGRRDGCVRIAEVEVRERTLVDPIAGIIGNALNAHSARRAAHLPWPVHCLPVKWD